MSFPFRSGLRPSTFNDLVKFFRSTVERFPDQRTGDNVQYSMADAAIGAFSVFFTQSPSFLDSQRNLEVTQGCSNARSLFGMTQTPSDNHIRNLLDPVPPSTVFPIFSHAVDVLHESGHLEPYRSINGDLLMAIDGTEYFSSSKIHCDQCNVREHKNGTVTYSHTLSVLRQLGRPDGLHDRKARTRRTGYQLTGPLPPKHSGVSAPVGLRPLFGTAGTGRYRWIWVWATAFTLNRHNTRLSPRPEAPWVALSY